MEKISLLGIIATSILLILGFITGKVALYKTQNSVKFFAYLSVIICTLFIIHFIAILGFSVISIISGNVIQAITFPIFIFLPFIIGHYTSYEKLHLFTNIQIFTLIISLVLAIFYI